MTPLSIEQLITRIVQEVLRELVSQNRTITLDGQPVYIGRRASGGLIKTETIDMTPYRTPVLTGNHIERLHELTAEIRVPEGTVITPKARELIREKRLTLVFNGSV